MRRILAAALAVVSAAVLAPAAAADVTPMTGWGRFEIISKDLNNATVRAFRNVNGLTPPTYGGLVTIGTGWLDSTHFVKFGDLNGDSYDEMISVGIYTQQVIAYRNRGDGTYDNPGILVGQGWNHPAGTYFADINGDNRDEVISLRDHGEVWAWPNVNGLNGFPYTQAPVLIGLGWSNPDRVFFAEIMS